MDLLQQQQQAALLQQQLLQQHAKFTEDEKIEVKRICEQIVTLKQESERLMTRSKEIRKDTKPLQDRLRDFMISRKIPSLQVGEARFNIIKGNANKKIAPKSSHLIASMEQLVGVQNAEKIKEQAQKIATEDPKRKKVEFKLSIVTLKEPSTEEVFSNHAE